MAGRGREWLWRNVVFTIVVPGTVSGLVPWLITRWSTSPWGPWPVVIALAATLILLGAAFLVHAIWRFATEGLGTPAPIAPTEELVVGGIYRYVRNPMYLSVGAVIGGQVLLSPSWGIGLYLISFLIATALFVRLYEEPTLLATHGAAYERYRQDVPGWVPRLRRGRG